jgi:uncharacterized protein (DUF2249 family)
MITEDLKVGDLLESYPGALDVMISISAHFNKLKNPILRKTLASRVTLEQAAKIAGVPLPQLLQRLNEELGGAAVSCGHHMGGEDRSVSREPAERPAWMDSLDPANEVLLDVRPILSSGKDPLKDILEGLRNLHPGQYLRLVNFFEPVPLYSIIGNKGFEHWTEEREGVFHVFLSGQWKASSEGSPRHDVADLLLEHDHALLEVDVRGLEPPEPMVRILEALSGIEEGGVLLVHHHREPMFLYDKLEERGFQAACQKVQDNYYKVLIKKKA